MCRLSRLRLWTTAVLLAACSAVLGFDWTITEAADELTCYSLLGLSSSVAWDSEGGLGLAYYDLGGASDPSYYRYQTYSHSTWSEPETIATMPGKGDIDLLNWCRWVDLEYGADDRARIVYHDTETLDDDSDDRAALLYETDTGWTDRTVYGHSGGPLGLELGEDDDVYVAHYYRTDLDVRYAHAQAPTYSSWVRRSVDTSGNSGVYGADIARDSSGTVYVAYQDRYGDIWCATSINDGTSWSKQQVYNSTYRCYYPSIALDSNEVPHIAFVDFTSTGSMVLKYSTWTGTTWSTTSLSGGPVAWSNVSLGFWGEYPYIAYASYSDYVAVSYNQGEGWRREEIALADDYAYPSLDVNLKGGVAISYYDGNANKMYVALAQTPEPGTPLILATGGILALVSRWRARRRKP
jgi:hypothetical protein